MIAFVIYILSSMTMLGVSAIPLQTRHRPIQYDGDFLRVLDPRRDGTNVIPPSSSSGNTPAPPIQVAKVPTATVGKNGTELSSVDDQLSPTSLVIDDLLNYDYDYFNYFYDLDFLEPSSTTYPFTTKQQSTTTSETVPLTTKKIDKTTIGTTSTSTKDTILRYKDFNRFQKELRKHTSKTPNSDLFHRGSLLKPFSQSNHKRTVKHQKPIKDTIIPTNQTTAKPAQQDVESFDVKVSNTTSISASVQDSPLDEKQELKNETNDGWTSFGSSVSYEVRVEASISGKNSVSSSSSPIPKKRDNFLIANENHNSDSINSNNQRRESFILEVSATPKTFEVNKLKTKEKLANPILQATKKENIDASSTTTTFRSTTHQSSSINEESVIATSPSTTISTKGTTSSTPEYLTISSKRNPVSTTLKPQDTTKAKRNELDPENIVTTLKSATTTVKPRTEPILNRPFISKSKSLTETSSDFQFNRQPRRRPFAFLRRIGEDRTRNLPPIMIKDRKKPYASIATASLVAQSHKSSIAKASALKSSPDIPLATEENPSLNKNASLTSTTTTVTPITKKRINSVPASNAGINPNQNIVPLALRSQLGANPHGVNPSGFIPFGKNPLGSTPFGAKPQGVAPLGPPLGLNMTVNATTVQPTTNASASNVTKERYHVQVKKPDGSINGDYIVLDHNTGSLSGVRYEAIDGADQALIQQALLSFLSLEPGQETNRQQKSLDGVISSSLSNFVPQPTELLANKQILTDQT